MGKTKILFVEDDKLQAKITSEYLVKDGYEIIHVENGKSAIKVAKSEPVDLIILDLVLPDMDGNDVCRWLKMNDDTKGIPIIVLTAKGSTMDKVTGLKAGADDYLAKPYNDVELNARIYASLRTKSLRDELKIKNIQLQELLAKVEALAITDPLTEISNRRHFWNVLDREFNRSIRFKKPISCLMIDVDHFKNINDQYGHRVGDIVLKELAQILTNCLRKIDVIARWGGEEFVVMLPETDKTQAFNAASRILLAVSEHPFPEVEKKITVSVGLACAPSSSLDTAEKLIDASDIALYEAKSKGRNRVELAA